TAIPIQGFSVGSASGDEDSAKRRALEALGLVSFAGSVLHEQYSPAPSTRASPSLAVNSTRPSRTATYIGRGELCRSKTVPDGTWRKMMLLAGGGLDTRPIPNIGSLSSISMSRKCDSPSASA